MTDLNPVDAMTTDYRALCTELSGLDGHCVVDCTEEWADAMCRLLAALAEPVAEGPTDEEVMELMPQQMRDDLATSARALAGFDRASIKATGAMRTILNRHAVDHARAVLAKWGHQ